MPESEHYTLPDGWLACDVCGRPVHHSGLDRHMGSVACQYEQREGEPPPGWIAVDTYAGGAYTIGFLAELKAPLFRRFDSEGKTYTAFVPPWVHIIAAIECDSSARAAALKRARVDVQYRAVVLAGLRLVSAKDRAAVLGVLDIGSQTS